MITEFENKVPPRFRSYAEPNVHLDHFSGIQLDESSDSKAMETDFDSTFVELECGCGYKGHEIFVEAKELLQNGKEEEALELFRECILDNKRLGDFIQKQDGGGFSESPQKELTRCH